MLHDTAARSKVTFWPDGYFQKLHDSARGPAILCGCTWRRPKISRWRLPCFMTGANTRYYAHAGAYQERNRKVKASVSLVWQALLDAKAAGLAALRSVGSGAGRGQRAPSGRHQRV
jgi:hypothetical protein